MIVYLTVGYDCLHVRATVKNKKKRFRVVSKRGLYRGIIRLLKKHGETPDDLHVMCSSSVDFPDEYTKNKKVIALCEELRS